MGETHFPARFGIKLLMVFQRLWIFYGFIFAITFPIPSYTQPSPSSQAVNQPIETITLDEYLNSLKERHPFFTKEAISPDIEKQQQERFLGAQDWVISSSPFSFYQEPIVTSSFSPNKMYGVGVGAGVERAYWNTGGRLSLFWSSDFSDQELPVEGFFNPIDSSFVSFGPTQFYQNKVFLTYSQPLLQNFGGDLDRLDYEVSQYTVDFTELQTQENQEGFLLDLGTRFLDWVLRVEQSRIENDRLRLAEEELQQSTRKRAANLVEQIDVLRAEDAVRIAKQNIVFIESKEKAKQAELAVLSQSQALYDQKPEYDLYNVVTLPSAEEAVSRVTEQSRILKALEIRKEQLLHLQNGFSETGRPQLFLTGQVGLQNGDSEFGNSWEIDKPDLRVSLDFRHPLGARTARSDVAKTNLQIRQVEDEINDVTLNLKSAVRNLLIQIDELAKVLTLNQEHIESARVKTKEELRLYNQGRNQLTFVIQSRDNEENAKLIYAHNGALYHTLILQYRSLMDELLTSGN
jgi:outer membrane protein TolC